MTGGQMLVAAAAAPFALAAAVADWRDRRVPNQLLAAVALGGVACVALDVDGAEAAVRSAVATAAVGLVAALVWLAAPRLVGAADVKAAFAVGPWVGLAGIGAALATLGLAFVLAVPHATVLLARRAERGVPFVVYVLAAGAAVVALTA